MNDIKVIPFDILSDRCKKAPPALVTKIPRPKDFHIIEEFIEEHNLIAKPWILPHMLAYFGEFKVFKNATGKYSAKTTLANALTDNAWGQGLYKLAMHGVRSSFVKDQNKDNGRHYCSLVPLILAGIKSHQHIKYSSWDTTELYLIVEPKLLEAMNYVVPEDLTRELLLKIRTVGLTGASGVKMGIVKPSKSTHGITGIKEFSLNSANTLARMMLVQTWCAHPENRTDAMILDPRDWDSMPKPLISTDIMKSEPPEPKVLVDAYFDKDKMPWE